MGLGKLLTHRPPAGAEHRTAGSTFEDILLQASVNGALSPYRRYQGGMGIPGAWRASLLISDLLGQVPWNAYTDYNSDVPRRIRPTPLLLEQPNPPDIRMTTISSWVLDLLWEGNAIGIVAARNGQGWPTAAYAVPAAAVGVRRITPQAWSTLPVGAIEYSVGTMTFGIDDILHFKGPCEPGALRGMGVLEQHFATLRLARAQQDQAASISQHGVPTGVLKSENPDLTGPEARALKTAWLESQQTRTIAVLNATTSFEPLSWNPEEMQLVEARKFTLTDWENIFGLPIGWLGGTTSSRQYSNIEQDAVNLLKFSLGGHLGRFEGEFTRHQPRGSWTKANLDAVLRSDTLSRYEAHASGIQAGWLEPNEARRKEDLEPIEGLDQKWLDKQGPAPKPEPPIRAHAQVVKAAPAQIEAGKPEPPDGDTDG